MPKITCLEELDIYTSRMRELYLEYPRLTEIKQDIDRLRYRDNRASESGVMTIIGQSGSGKTKLILDYMSGFPVQPRAIHTPGGWADRREVVLVSVPDTNSKNLLERLYKELLGVEPSGRRRFDYQDEIPKIAAEMGTRLIIFDEAHQGIDNKTDKVAHDLAVLFKDLSNAAVFSLLLVGTEQVIRILDANKELGRRNLGVHELVPFDWDNADDREHFLDIIRDADQNLAGIFGRLSGLDEIDLAIRIHVASRGVVGKAAKLIEEAAVRAGREFLDGRTDRIGWKHLTYAFGFDADNRFRPNPFKIPPGSTVTPDIPAAEPQIQLPNKLRRGQREALVNKR